MVSAYDGHRVARGRVVCDSTWHHFVNVNLIGLVEGAGFDDFDYPGHPGTPGTSATKHDGFLSSPAGRAALDKIREYFVNVGVWIDPSERVTCMSNHLWFELVFADRIVEATLAERDVPLDRVPVHKLFEIGVHARDVIGRLAGACQSIHFWFPHIPELVERLVPWWDPWRPGEDARPVLPWFDPQPIADIAVGGAVVALRDAFPVPPEDIDSLYTDDTMTLVSNALAASMRRALMAASSDLSDFARMAEAAAKS